MEARCPTRGNYDIGSSMLSSVLDTRPSTPVVSIGESIAPYFALLFLLNRRFVPVPYRSEAQIKGSVVFLTFNFMLQSGEVSMILRGHI